MKTIEERAKEIKDEFGLAGLEDDLNEQVWDTTWGEIINLVERAYVKGATEQKAIDKEYYKELIDMLIDELQTSRVYHLGITGLDSDAEIARKEQEGNTALIRGIDRTIKYVRKAMEE